MAGKFAGAALRTGKPRAPPSRCRFRLEMAGERTRREFTGAGLEPMRARLSASQFIHCAEQIIHALYWLKQIIEKPGHLRVSLRPVNAAAYRRAGYCEWRLLVAPAHKTRAYGKKPRPGFPCLAHLCHGLIRSHGVNGVAGRTDDLARRRKARHPGQFGRPFEAVPGSRVAFTGFREWNHLPGSM